MGFLKLPRMDSVVGVWVGMKSLMSLSSFSPCLHLHPIDPNKYLLLSPSFLFSLSPTYLHGYSYVIFFLFRIPTTPRSNTRSNQVPTPQTSPTSQNKTSQKILMSSDLRLFLPSGHLEWKCHLHFPDSKSHFLNNFLS